jgi:hypothetical protein
MSNIVNINKAQQIREDRVKRNLDIEICSAIIQDAVDLLEGFENIETVENLMLDLVIALMELEDERR